MPSDLPQASEVAAQLARHIEALCRDFLPAGRRHGAYWSVGGTDNSKGASMWVHLRGPRQGRWRDAATVEGGDALDLVAACRCNGDKKAAYHWALAYLGLTPGSVPRPAPRAPAPPRGDDDAIDEQKHKAAFAIWKRAEADLTDTPVDLYLRGRGINVADLQRPPAAIHFHPELYNADSRCHFPAMVTAISLPNGGRMAIHRTWLECVEGRWIKARVARPKMCFAPFAGGSIRLSAGASGAKLRDAPDGETVVIGEGIETCLSVAIACPELRVLCGVSLGNLGAVWLPPQIGTVILCAEADEKPEARAAFVRAVAQHQSAGRQVRIARPQLGKDFNDTLREAA